MSNFNKCASSLWQLFREDKTFYHILFLYEMPCPGFWLLNLFFGGFFTLLIVHFFVGLVTRQLHLSEFALVLISYISLKLCIFVLLEH